MMLGEKVPAADAERMGMIYKIFPDDAFAGEAMKIANTLALMPTKAFHYTKMALNASMDHTLTEQLIYEDGLQQKAATTEDYKEGVNAFLEKRKAEFKGR